MLGELSCKSGVMDADLRDWLTDYKNYGLLNITNQRPGQRLACKGKEQYLKWGLVAIPSRESLDSWQRILHDDAAARVQIDTYVA